MGLPRKLKIGELAQQSGVAVGALRYYESLNLLKAERGDNGYRYYSPNTVHTIHFIKKAQSLGFSLDDIKEVLNLHQQGNLPCNFVRSRLQEKINQLEHQIQSMMQFKTTLEEYRDRWNEQESVPNPEEICPLIAAVPLNNEAGEP